MASTTAVVLASGRGTNLQAVLDAVAARRLDLEVVAVVANRRASEALTRAERAGITTAYVPLKPYRDAGRSREDYDRDVAELVSRFDAEWIVCLGWMHLFSPAFLDRFPGRVINLHPALPGAFPGKDALGQAWEAWQAGTIDHTGCMVHHVVPEVDAGPALATATVAFRPGEPREAFEARFHAAEHELVVDVLRALSMRDAPHA